MKVPTIVLLVATVGVVPAAAQSHVQPRVEISANVGAQNGSTSFTESEAFPVNAETETLTADHGSKTAVGFNVGAAVQVVPRFWVGVQLAIADVKPGATIMALVPHPLIFNAPRMVQGTTDALAHNEQNVHVDLMYALPLRALDVKVMGGPTIFTVKQDFVSAITVNETYPFDTATFASASTTRLSKTAVGFNGAVDISHPISRMVAVGGLIRYSRANVKFNAQGSAQTVKAGGLEASAGIRLRF